MGDRVLGRLVAWIGAKVVNKYFGGYELSHLLAKNIKAGALVNVPQCAFILEGNCELWCLGGLCGELVFGDCQVSLFSFSVPRNYE